MSSPAPADGITAACRLLILGRVRCRRRPAAGQANRRTARKRGLLFLRLMERAVEAGPIRYADIVANPKKTGRQGTLPGRREWPGTLAVAPLDRPWRTAG